MSHILNSIDGPQQLKELSIRELEQLALELRNFIIENVAMTGGHLASSLGVVDLTIALHKVFNCPQDKIIWDVGHQAYSHKILTGRKDRFYTLRQKGGISGFPKREESPYDSFGVGHSSTSVSAALGFAIARDLDHRRNHVLAVIGDGAFTGGEVFEALNHAGDLGKKMIVVLNDNEMSIDRNVGALSEYLAKIRAMPEYLRARKDLEVFLRSIPRIGETVLKKAEKLKDSVKEMFIPGGLFKELGVNYIGPVDGHNINLLVHFFEDVKQIDGPVLVHVQTKKGKGYLPAELEPDKFHGIGRFDAGTGKIYKKKGQPLSYTAVFGQTMLDLAAQEEDLVAITAAMPSGMGLKHFSKEYPERFFDVGIAEQHAVTLAAGLAAAGKKPVVALYSTFAQRAYDQILHDICLQDLPVVLCLDRAGIVGEDGPTHHGVFDISYLRSMPNMTIMAPKDENEFRQMIFTAVGMKKPVAIRYPRGCARGVHIEESLTPLEVGKAEVLQRKGKIAFLAFGTMVEVAEEAAKILSAEEIDVTVINARFAKPLDETVLSELAENMDLIITIEENVLAGGFGTAIMEFFHSREIQPNVKSMGIPDVFIEQGSRNELLKQYGLTAEAAVSMVKKLLKE